MADPESIDPAFLHALADFVGTTQEVEFERRGSSDSTYTLHGIVVSVDHKNGTIQIQRTRTHAGEVHEMGLWYFLSATPRTGLKIQNRIAVERNEMFREKQRDREAAVVSATLNLAYRPDPTNRRTLFVGRRQGHLNGYPTERYVYQGLEGGRREVGLIASSLAAADNFISRQEIFMPLDDMVWHAINSRVLWPAGIAFDRQVKSSAWSLDWFKLFDVLAGIPKDALKEYLDLIHRGCMDSSLSVARKVSDTTSLSMRGLLVVESSPNSFVEILERVPVAGLRQLLKEASSNSKARTRVTLIEALSSLMTPELEASAVRLMRSSRMQVKAPAGLAFDEFDRAIRELRDSIFLMRQWLLATREIYREDELRQLVSVV